MKNIIKKCEREIRLFGSVINEAIKQVAIAKRDAIEYRKQINILQAGNNEKIKKAYALGYKAGQDSMKDDVSGGVSKVENTKLVLRQD